MLLRRLSKHQRYIRCSLLLSAALLTTMTSTARISLNAVGGSPKCTPCICDSRKVSAPYRRRFASTRRIRDVSPSKRAQPPCLYILRGCVLYSLKSERTYTPVATERLRSDASEEARYRGHPKHSLVSPPRRLLATAPLSRFVLAYGPVSPATG